MNLASTAGDCGSGGASHRGGELDFQSLSHFLMDTCSQKKDTLEPSPLSLPMPPTHPPEVHQGSSDQSGAAGAPNPRNKAPRRLMIPRIPNRLGALRGSTGLNDADNYVVPSDPVEQDISGPAW